MQWFKLYVEARNDAKLRSLSAEQFRVWFNLLCYASEQSDRGIIEAEDSRLLAIEVAGGNVDLLDETCNALQALRIVTSVTSPLHARYIAFLNFDKRQGSRVTCNAKSSAERVRKYRERKKLGHDETNVTRCNADVTRVTPLEEELEGEREGDLNTPPNPQGGGVWVSTGGSDPVPIEDALKPAAPPVDPAELARVQAKAEALFPTRDFGYQVAVASYDWPLDWIDSALSELASSGKKDWHYLGGILKRYGGSGGPARASPKPTQAEKSKVQDDAFAALGDDPEFLKACDKIRGRNV